VLTCLRLLAPLLAVAVATPIVSAAEFIFEDIVTIPADEVWEDDVYIFAQQVVVEGTIEGDLVVTAQSIDVPGTVEGSLIAACQQIRMAGRFGRSSRIACHSALVADGATLGKDLVFAGYALETAKNSRIDGDLVAAGFQVVHRGIIEEDVWAAVNRASIEGKIEGELSITADGREGQPPTQQQFGPNAPQLFSIPSVRPGLNIEDEGSVGGRLIYKSPDEVEISEGADVAGPIERIDMPEAAPQQKKTNAALAIEQIKRYASLLILGVLMVLVCPRSTSATVEQMMERPIASFFAGIIALPLSLVLVFVIAAMMVIVPAVLGAIHFDELSGTGALLSFYALLVYLGGWIFFFAYGTVIVVSISMGRIIFSSNTPAHRGWLLLALGFGLIFYVVLTCVPYLRVGIWIATILFAFGAYFLWLIVWLFFRSEAKEKVTA